MQRVFSFLLFCFFTLTAQSALFERGSNFLKVDDAFQLSVQQTAQQEALLLHWQVAEGYYLYRDKIQIRLVDQENVLSAPVFSQEPKSYQDPYFGQTFIFNQGFDAEVRVIQPPLAANSRLEVTYQGCTEGFCYPPETKDFDVVNLPVAQIPLSQDNKGSNVMPASQQDRLAAELNQSKWAILGFFLLGLGLAFTPCVLPMLPLLSAIVIGSQQRPNMWRALGLSVVYVQGMALTYTLLGLVVAAIGLPFQVALQHPAVMIGLSVIFVLLALSMFGLFNLQLPASWQTKLTLLSQRQQAGAFGGVFLMGMIAGLVASPCTSAPLSGALLYVAQSGDLLTGALTLYLLALGMGVPLILITLFGNKILPKSGMWMETVKKLFGFVMLALPVFLLSRILPEIWAPRLWALLGTAFFVWFALQMPKQGIGQLVRIVFFGAAMVCVQPLQQWLWGTEVMQPKNAQAVFKRIHNTAELQQALADNSKPLVMLDLYADWCVACKEFDHQTFNDPEVQQAFEEVLLLQVDMTQNSPENQALMAQYLVLGLPTILFFDQQGNELKNARITGFMPPSDFLQWLEKIRH